MQNDRQDILRREKGSLREPQKFLTKFWNFFSYLLLMI